MSYLPHILLTSESVSVEKLLLKSFQKAGKEDARAGTYYLAALFSFSFLTCSAISLCFINFSDSASRTLLCFWHFPFGLFGEHTEGKEAFSYPAVCASSGSDFLSQSHTENTVSLTDLFFLMYL